MRACAEICEIALRVEGDLLAPLGVLLDQLLLIRLAGHLLHGLRRRQLETLERDIFLDNLLHLGLDFLEIFAGNRRLEIEVVVEAVVHRRADCELCARVQAADCLRENVRGGVPVGLFAVRIVKREDLHLAVLRERRAQVAHLSIYARGARGLVKPHADALRDLRHTDAAFKFLFAALEIDLNHSFFLSAYSLFKISSEIKNAPKSLSGTSGRHCAIPPEFMRAGPPAPRTSFAALTRQNVRLQGHSPVRRRLRGGFPHSLLRGLSAGGPCSLKEAPNSGRPLLHRFVHTSTVLKKCQHPAPDFFRSGGQNNPAYFLHICRKCEYSEKKLFNFQLTYGMKRYKIVIGMICAF